MLQTMEERKTPEVWSYFWFLGRIQRRKYQPRKKRGRLKSHVSRLSKFQRYTSAVQYIHYSEHDLKDFFYIICGKTWNMSPEVQHL